MHRITLTLVVDKLSALTHETMLNVNIIFCSHPVFVSLNQNGLLWYFGKPFYRSMSLFGEQAYRSLRLKSSACVKLSKVDAFVIIAAVCIFAVFGFR